MSRSYNSNTRREMDKLSHVSRRSRQKKIRRLIKQTSNEATFDSDYKLALRHEFPFHPTKALAWPYAKNTG